MKENTIGVVLAGGYGALRPGVSKLVESVSVTLEKPMISCVVDVFQKLNIPTVIVINTVNKDQVMGALRHCDNFIIQEKRVGNGGAVRLCLPFISALEKKMTKTIATIVVLYGDMPLWKSGSIQRLLESHVRSSAAISMFSVHIRKNCPEMVGKYGRILRNSEGRIIGVREPYQLTQKEITETVTANPSAWMFSRKWLEKNIDLLTPHDMGDGHPPEYWLPDLVEIASSQGQCINEVPLEEFWQAMGVNTHKELEEVRVCWKEFAMS